jgi:hypothetical protein
MGADSKEARQLLHGLHLFGIKAAVAADLEVTQFESPESRADQVDDPAVHGFDHAPHQALLPARHGDPEIGQITAPADDVCFRRPAEPLVQVHAAAESLECGLRHLALYGDLVSLGNMKAGVSQAVRPFAVVGQKQETQAVKIETAYRVDPFLDPCEQIGHHWPSFRVTERTHEAEGLVHHEVEPVGMSRNRLSVHPDVVCPPDRLSARFSQDLSIDRDPACLDPLVRFASRGDSCKGKDSVNPLTQGAVRPGQRFPRKGLLRGGFLPDPAFGQRGFAVHRLHFQEP